MWGVHGWLVYYNVLMHNGISVQWIHKNFQKANALIILDYFVAVDYGLGLPAIIISGFSSGISVDVVFTLWCLVGTVLLVLCFVFLFLPPLYKLFNGNIQHWSCEISSHIIHAFCCFVHHFNAVFLKHYLCGAIDLACPQKMICYMYIEDCYQNWHGFMGNNRVCDSS